MLEEKVWITFQEITGVFEETGTQETADVDHLPCLITLQRLLLFFNAPQILLECLKNSQHFKDV